MFAISVKLPARAYPCISVNFSGTLTILESKEIVEVEIKGLCCFSPVALATDILAKIPQIKIKACIVNRELDGPEKMCITQEVTERKIDLKMSFRR